MACSGLCCPAQPDGPDPRRGIRAQKRKELFPLIRRRWSGLGCLDVHVTRFDVKESAYSAPSQL